MKAMALNETVVLEEVGLFVPKNKAGNILLKN
jgi:hypothetical protein